MVTAFRGLSANKDGENSFHHCESPVKLMQTCLCAGNTLQRRFNRSVRAVNYVLACLSASKGRGSSSHHCGGPVKLLYTSLIMCGKHPKNAVLPAQEVL